MERKANGSTWNKWRTPPSDYPITLGYERRATQDRLASLKARPDHISWYDIMCDGKQRYDCLHDDHWGRPPLHRDRHPPPVYPTFRETHAECMWQVSHKSDDNFNNRNGAIYFS